MDRRISAKFDRMRGWYEMLYEWILLLPYTILLQPLGIYLLHSRPTKLCCAQCVKTIIIRYLFFPLLDNNAIF